MTMNLTGWKTTAEGVLAVLLGTSGPVTALIAALQAAKPAPNYTLTYVGLVLTCIFAIMRVWIGLLQNDAPPPATITPITVTMPVPVTVTVPVPKEPLK